MNNPNTSLKKNRERLFPTSDSLEKLATLLTNELITNLNNLPNEIVVYTRISAQNPLVHEFSSYLRTKLAEKFNGQAPVVKVLNSPTQENDYSFPLDYYLAKGTMPGIISAIAPNPIEPSQIYPIVR